MFSVLLPHPPKSNPHESPLLPGGAATFALLPPSMMMIGTSSIWLAFLTEWLQQECQGVQ